MYKIEEDLEALEAIARLDERINLEQTDVNGKKITVVHKGYASTHLFEIKRFVADIIENGWKEGFIDEFACYSNIPRIRTLCLGKKYYFHVNDWLERYSDFHHYSPRVEAFYDTCKSMGLIGQNTSFYFGSPSETECNTGIRYMDWFNALCIQVSARCQGREFKERERLRRLNAERNKRNVLALEEEMFSEDKGRSRWLVLSLTLRYKPADRRGITLEVIQQHRDRFFAARGFNDIMSGIKNYVWTIEQGEDTGLHLHVILFYSAESNHDEYIARQAGEYWVDVVTDGKGDYWNSNDGKLIAAYEKKGHGVGIGQINWYDIAERSALRVNLAYLAKVDQEVMIKPCGRFRTFGMGQVQEKEKSGRRRTT